MTDYAMKLSTFVRPEQKNATPIYGTVRGDRFATFASLEGMTVRCTSGSLWVTLENDVMDHVVRTDRTFTIPAKGKVIIGGRGSYSLEPATRMPLAS